MQVGDAVVNIGHGQAVVGVHLLLHPFLGFRVADLLPAGGIVARVADNDIQPFLQPGTAQGGVGGIDHVRTPAPTDEH